MPYSSSKVATTKKMYKMNIATPVNLFIRQPHAAIVMTTMSNIANSSTVEQNIPWLFTGYALPPELMLYSNHGNGNLQKTSPFCKCIV